MTKKSEKTATKIQSALERIVLELYVWCNGWYPRAYKDPRISLREIADRAYNVLQQETDQCEQWLSLTWEEYRAMLAALGDWVEQPADVCPHIASTTDGSNYCKLGLKTLLSYAGESFIKEE
ncbi:MAG: hypothetical protein EBV86_17925 [Marivivens sp.]|nr:hypothetical protein [Marivivens sp.]